MDPASHRPPSAASPASPARLSRRAWLRGSLAAGAAIGLPTILPSRALGRDGRAAPSERILLGGIGLGVRGQVVLREMLDEPDVQFLAICDVNRSRRTAVKELVDAHYGNSDCAMAADLRAFLADRTDLDAVLIATGDRWHALASVLAMRAGKDVYCEKPASMTIAEGRLVADTAHQYGRVYQCGTQGLSWPNLVFGIELARSGGLGEVHTAYAQIAPWGDAIMQRDWLVSEPEPPPAELDWNAWLGPCPWRPYNGAYVRGEWRNHYDFHTGCIGEWGAHTVMQVQAGLDLRETSAIAYEPVADPTGHGLVARYANGVTLVLSLTEDCWGGTSGQRFDGTEGWVANSGADHTLSRASSPALLERVDPVLAEYTARTARPLSHNRDFLDCVKSRRQTVAYPEAMHRAMSTVHAANISMWLGRPLRFDPLREEFIDDSEANLLRARRMRAPWTA